MNAQAKNVLVKLRHNWGLKVLASVLGALTFYAIRWTTGNEKDFLVPIEIEVESGVAVLAQDTEFVTVSVRGSQDDLLKLDSSQMRAFVRSHEGEPDGLPRTVAITPRDIEGAPNVSVVKIEPSKMMLTFDREVETTFSVAPPVTKGRPLVGSVKIEYSPTTVKVAGPKRRLEELKRSGQDQLQTVEVDVDGRGASFSRRAAILPPEGTLVSKIDPPEVMVKVTIVRDIASRRLEGLPIKMLAAAGLRDRLVAQPDIASVILEGQPTLVNSLTNRDVRVFVDCDGVDFSEERDLSLSIHIPVQEGVIYRAEPASVKVRLLQPLGSEETP